MGFERYVTCLSIKNNIQFLKVWYPMDMLELTSEARHATS